MTAHVLQIILGHEYQYYCRNIKIKGTPNIKKWVAACTWQSILCGCCCGSGGRRCHSIRLTRNCTWYSKITLKQIKADMFHGKLHCDVSFQNKPLLQFRRETDNCFTIVIWYTCFHWTKRNISHEKNISVAQILLHGNNSENCHHTFFMLSCVENNCCDSGLWCFHGSPICIPSFTRVEYKRNNMKIDWHQIWL
jgi:hypothetical protein